MLDKSKLYYVNDRETDTVAILFEDAISWYVAEIKQRIDGHGHPIRRSLKKTSFTLNIVRQHTVWQVIEQCICRWELSEHFTYRELDAWVMAAETIKDELKAEGY